MDKLVEKVAKSLFNPKLVELHPSMRWENLPEGIRQSYLDTAKRIMQAILSDPTIVEIDPDVELPDIRFSPSAVSVYDRNGKPISHADAARYTQQDMIDAGWVKPKEEK